MQQSVTNADSMPTFLPSSSPSFLISLPPCTLMWPCTVARMLKSKNPLWPTHVHISGGFKHHAYKRGLLLEIIHNVPSYQWALEMKQWWPFWRKACTHVCNASMHAHLCTHTHSITHMHTHTHIHRHNTHTRTIQHNTTHAHAHTHTFS